MALPPLQKSHSISREALAAAAELDVVLEENPGLLAVVSDMLRPESLPAGWEARFDEEKGRREYVHAGGGEVQYTHPLAAYYRGAAFMEAGGYSQLQAAEAEQPPAPQEVSEMCAYLGVGGGEDAYVVEVARMAISAPLPPGWEEGEDDDGNPLFSNAVTGETQPSHPLDPYFMELIARRRKELMIRTDGVGIRSAIAAKRLAAIGMPGVAVPPELQDDEEGLISGGVDGDDGEGQEDNDDPPVVVVAPADLDDDEEGDGGLDIEGGGGGAEVAAIHAEGFGALVTITEDDNEGNDEDDGPLVLPPPAFAAGSDKDQAAAGGSRRASSTASGGSDRQLPTLSAGIADVAALRAAAEAEAAAAAAAAAATAPSAAADDAHKPHWAADGDDDEDDDKGDGGGSKKAAGGKKGSALVFEHTSSMGSHVSGQAEPVDLPPELAWMMGDPPTRPATEQQRKKKNKKGGKASDDDDDEGEEEEEGEEQQGEEQEDQGKREQKKGGGEEASAAAAAAADDGGGEVVDLAGGLRQAQQQRQQESDGTARLVLGGGGGGAGPRGVSSKSHKSARASSSEEEGEGGKEAEKKPQQEEKEREEEEDGYEDDFESYIDDFASYTSSVSHIERSRSQGGAASRLQSARSARSHRTSVTAPNSRKELLSGAAAATAGGDDGGGLGPDGRLRAVAEEDGDEAEEEQQEQEQEKERKRAAAAAASRAASARQPSPPAFPQPDNPAPRRSPGASAASGRGGARRSQGQEQEEDVEEEEEEEEDRDVPMEEEAVEELTEDGEGGARMGPGPVPEPTSKQPSRKSRVMDLDLDRLPSTFSLTPLYGKTGHGKSKTGKGGPWGRDLRRVRSFSEIETGRLRKQLDMLAAAGVGQGSAAALAAAANVGWKTPAGGLSLAAAGGGGGAGGAGGGGGGGDKTPARERIRVALRSRPLQKRGEISAWVVDPGTRTVRLKEGMGTKHSAAGRVFAYDLVLGPDAQTRQLWSSHVAPLVDAALGGVNATVFAYGQTGSGKTYTMFGPNNPNDPAAAKKGGGGGGGRGGDGVIGMSLTYLFQALQAQIKERGATEEYVVKVSMLELYNEQLRDLLSGGGGGGGGGKAGGGGGGGGGLALQDDPRTGVRVVGLQEQPVSDMRGAMALVSRGFGARSVGSTAMNEVSSRSHTILRLALETREAITHDLLHTALVSFVDLAGSERLAKTGSSGARFAEGTNINLSLLSLGTVVSRLAEGRRGDFIPYRNSKLTRLLQPCLGGNAKTAIIAVVNPSSEQIDETFNTLNFATRAMAVVNQVSVNEYVRASGAVGGALSGAAAAALQKQVVALKAELAAAKRNGGGGGGGPGGVIPDSVLAERVSRLELDKAQLLDRLEAITGKPVGDVYDDLPPTPPDLHLPTARPHSRAARTADKAAGGGAGGGGAATKSDAAGPAAAALRSIARVAYMGRGGGAPRNSEQVPPEEVVVAVREMRAERDELRRRDAVLRGQLEAARERAGELEPIADLGNAVAEAVNVLEGLMGPSPLADPHSGDATAAAAAANHAARLAENVAAVVLMHNELASLQRQLVTSEAMAAVAARRADGAEAAMQRLAAAAAGEWAAREAAAAAEDQDGGDEARKAAAELKVLTEQLNNQLGVIREELEVTKDELAQWRGLAGLPPEVAGAAEDAVAAALAGALDSPGADGGVHGGGLGPGGPHNPDTTPGGLLLTPASLNVGSFAIKRAREALAKVASLEARALAAEAEREELKERLQSLEEAVAAVPGGPRVMLPPVRGGAGGASTSGEGPAGSADGRRPPVGASAASSSAGPGGAQRFEQLKQHVASLSREVAALTRERDSLLAIVLKMQGPAAAGAIGALASSVNGIASGSSFSSVPVAPGGGGGGLIGLQSMGAAGGGGGGGGGGGRPAKPGRSGIVGACKGSPSKLRPRGPSDSGLPRPDFNTRDVPLEAKQRVARIRDRATKLDATLHVPGMAPVPEPVLAGARDAEVFALKRKLVAAEKARAEALAKAQAEMRAMQMALAAANKEAKDIGRAQAAQIRQVEVAHEEELTAVRSEAATMVRNLMDENARLRMALAAAGAGGGGGGGGQHLPSSPGQGAGGGGGGRRASGGGSAGGGVGGGGFGLSSILAGMGGADFQLKSLGGFGGGGGGGGGGGSGAGSSANSSPAHNGNGAAGGGRGPRASPLRGSNLQSPVPVSPGGGGGGFGAAPVSLPNIPPPKAEKAKGRNGRGGRR
ncbi:hypothetical protein HYH02_005500 [Chlamydomonas schloesseri]|uniref:Kinesin motor domain-containing protein n=1 Tax=Chlamydomonas schloesseri TaxID=2026947 RepID=A0A836B6Z8_9CHLO|nr:hypothetical protein HYH02_005500 [Chlamydomonas schloesseri]|eukprot:KAG2449345.1 hypothetical protein HYH02_005500 [Chlamydomonas schloesseri]